MTHGPDAVVLFVDGLDHDFVLRNFDQIDGVFCRDSVFRVDGVLHSIECLGQVLAGRRDPLLEVSGRSQLPDSERIINWDLLLDAIPAEELIWHCLNRMGLSVGLFEMLGVFISPALDGFCLTKHTGKLGLGGLFKAGLTHHPPSIGRLFAELRRQYNYPLVVRQSVEDYRQRLLRPLADCSTEELLDLMQACGYHELIGVVETNLHNLLLVLGEILAQQPVDVLFLHTGYLDTLLHLYLEMPSWEPSVMGRLRQLIDGVRRQLGASEILVFSDHGMVPAQPHDAEGMIHRTDHCRERAVLMAAGPQLEAHLRDRPPRDLTSVYTGVLAAAGGLPGEQGQLPATCLLRQLQQIILDRERLLLEMDRALELAQSTLAEQTRRGRQALLELGEQLHHCRTKQAAASRELAELRRRPEMRVGELLRRIRR